MYNRKSIWKLLDSFSKNYQNNEIDEDVIAFFENLLSQDPKLIHCSAKPSNDRLQDDFIEWLIIKLIKQIDCSKAIRLDKNVALQKKILMACNARRSILFRRLLKVYNNFIDDVTSSIKTKLLLLDAEDGGMQHDEENKENTFTSIKYGLVLDIESSAALLLQTICEIMTYALQIDLGACNTKIYDDAQQILKVLQIGNFQTKVKCFHYFSELLSVARLKNIQVSCYIEMVMNALAEIFELKIFWFRMQAIEETEIMEFENVAIKLLAQMFEMIKERKSRITEKFKGYFYKSIIVEIQMHQEMMSNQRMDNDFLRTCREWLLILLQKDWFEFAILEQHHGVILSYFKINDSSKHRALVVFTFNEIPHLNAEKLECLYKYLENGFITEIQRKIIDYKTIKYLLEAIWIFECRNAAKELSRLKPEVMKKFIKISMEAFQKSDIPVKEKKMILIILALILQINILRSKLLKADCDQVLELMEMPLKQALNSPPLSSGIVSKKTKIDSDELVALSFEILCKLRIQNDSALENSVDNILSAHVKKLFQVNFPHSVKSSLLSVLRTSFKKNLKFLLSTQHLKHQSVFAEFLEKSNTNENLEMSTILEAYCCSIESEVFLVLDPERVHETNDSEESLFTSYETICIACEKPNNHEKTTNKIRISKSSKAQQQQQPSNKIILPWNVSHVKSKIQSAIKSNDLQYNFLRNHLETSPISGEECLALLFSSDNHYSSNEICLNLLSKLIGHNDYNLFRTTCISILKEIHDSLDIQDRLRRKAKQLDLLNVLRNLVQNKIFEENWLLSYFKLTSIYLVHPASAIRNEAIVFAQELCASHNTEPIVLWNLYKKNLQEFILPLIIFGYLKKGLRINRSLRNFSEMLGFSCVQEFIYKNHRLILSTLLPYCMRNQECKGLLLCIAKTTRKSIASLLVSSFRRIYCYIHSNETEKFRNYCVNYVTKTTNRDIKSLLNSNVKETVGELLTYFNRMPNSVMEAFQYLIHPKKYVGQQPAAAVMRKETMTKIAMQQFREYISERFLGILTYFETLLRDISVEKSLKRDALCSLGQIIRFVDTEQHITKHRFKIAGILDSAYALNDEALMKICLAIWNVFLEHVKLQESDASLSHITALLYPMLEKHQNEVNKIYENIVVRNSKNLPSTALMDLYFLKDNRNVKTSIRNRILDESKLLSDETAPLLDQISFFFKQMSSESSQVRMLALKYLTEFFQKNRGSMNRLVLHELRDDDMLLEKVTNVLINSCKQDDRELQLSAARCLGELGAVDPGYMPFGNHFERGNFGIFLSVHTDNFAIMALTELCRSYQFQNDGNHNNNYSLAIQETLSICGISPKDNKKTTVWEAIPENMREVMLPLLTSCYAMSQQERICREHPIYNSGCYRNYSEWAFLFASRLIDFVKGEPTKRLLTSYKPSIKRNSNILGIFFPYILLHSLQDCSETEMQKIFVEFDAVFKTGSRRATAFQHQEHRKQGQKQYSLKCRPKQKQTNMILGLDNQMLNNVAEDIVRCCIKHCSEQLTFLQRWLHSWDEINSALLTQSGNNKEVNDYQKITAFIKKFDKRFIAQANHSCGEYAQALLCLEEFLESEKQVQLQDELSFLIEIYCGLGDTDSVEGALYLKKTNLNLLESILVNQITGQNHASIICYEQLLSKDIEGKAEANLNQDFIKGIINCYVALETPETALLIANGLWQKFTEQFSDDCFAEGRLEALWRLGRYDELEEAFNCAVTQQRHTASDAKDCWSIQCAEALLLFKTCRPIEKDSVNDRHNDVYDDKLNGLVDKLNLLRLNTVQNNLSYAKANEQKAYSYFYDEVVKLHLLTEVEKMKSFLCNILKRLQPSKDLNAQEKKCILSEANLFFQEMDARLRVLKPTVHVVESVLCFRRNLFTEAKRWLSNSGAERTESDLNAQLGMLFNKEIGKLWLLSLQKHKDVGNLEQAYAALVKAEQYSPECLFIEKTKLLWKKGNQTAALKLLDESIELFNVKSNSNVKNLNSNERFLYAEAKFLQATFNAEAKNICCELNIKYYTDAIAANKQSEKYYVNFAQYMEQMYERYSPLQKYSEYGCKMILDIMLSYAKSLRYGYENVYQSLPRLLSLWLDYTSEAKSLNAAGSQAIFVNDTARKMNDLLSNCTSVFPAAVLYTAVSQILSRICHLSEDVFGIIRTIVIKLLEHFPHQTLWLILPVLKSSYVTRIKRCKLILSDSRLASGKFQKLIIDFNMLSERLIELANKDVAFDRPYALDSLVKQLPKLFTDTKFSKILLPFEKHMQVIFPITSSSSSWSDTIDLGSGQKRSSGDLSKPTNPFPYKPVFIVGINEEVTVLRSAAKPKKISFRCDDGNQYAVMIKPKDDLRRDFRLMEFNALVKRYLHLDSNARHRRLQIRTYSVIPFNEECGLVEWLPNLISFRNICATIYRKFGLGLLDKNLRQYALPTSEPIEKKRSVFNNVLLKNHPPVFHIWFRRQFLSPSAWYEARCSYVKTVAVMSIVGYILGLGDRHGENLLFDETNGEAVHVDFNCLFNQGELFAYPELVPFRLTHNMTFAMGPLGVEGLYRKCCEITLRVLKQQNETLMSVLRPFVYDLVVFNRNTEKQLHKGTELTDPKAVNDVRRINQRLQGHVRKTVSDSMPLSVEGQVNFLINESTSIDNLAAMYIGWGAYL